MFGVSRLPSQSRWASCSAPRCRLPRGSGGFPLGVSPPSACAVATCYRTSPLRGRHGQSGLAHGPKHSCLPCARPCVEALGDPRRVTYGFPARGHPAVGLRSERGKDGQGRSVAQRTGVHQSVSGGGGMGLSARALCARSTAHLPRRPVVWRRSQRLAPHPPRPAALHRRCAVAAPAGSRRSAPDAGARADGRGRPPGFLAGPPGRPNR